MQSVDEIRAIKKEISFAARIINSPAELDFEDRDAALRSLGEALANLDALELAMMPEADEVYA